MKAQTDMNNLQHLLLNLPGKSTPYFDAAASYYLI